MGDVFIERMVKKKFDSKDTLITVLLIAAAFVLIGVSLFILLPMTNQIIIPFFVTVGAVFGGYKLISMRNLEYEYSITNGFVAVDKIINRNSRKRLTAFECKDIEEIGEYSKNQSRLQNREVQTKIFASEFADGRNSWYVIVNAKKTGRTLLVFDPDERFLNAVKQFLSAHLRFEVFGRNR